MSLDQLPNELIAHIGTFLEYKDITQFALTKKRVHAALKSYGLNKPKADRLEFLTLYGEKVNCILFLNKSFDPVYLDTFYQQKKHGSYTLKMLDYINKFYSIDVLVIEDIFLHDTAAWGTIRTKMRTLELNETGFWTSFDIFMSFCKKFKRITFISTNMDYSRINDEFIWNLTQNGTTVLFKSADEVYSRPVVAITDATLDTLFETSLKEELSLDTLVSSISFKRIKKMIEDALSNGLRYITWNFGFLKQTQYHTVIDFCENQFQEWADSLQLPLLVNRIGTGYEFRDRAMTYKKYVIYHRYLNMGIFVIEFAVNIPGDIIRQEDPNFVGDEAIYD